MQDQGVEPGPLLGLKDPGNCLAIGGISREAIHRFRWDGHQLALFQEINGAGNVCANGCYHPAKIANAQNICRMRLCNPLPFCIPKQNIQK